MPERLTSEHEMLYAAASTEFGLVVTGNAKRLRAARSDLRDDVAMVDLAVLGPDERGQIWLVRKDQLRSHLVGGQQ